MAVSCKRRLTLEEIQYLREYLEYDMRSTSTGWEEVDKSARQVLAEREGKRGR